jgi:hypothetical protein
MKHVTSFQRPLKYLKICGAGLDSTVLEPIILSSPRLSSISVVHFDIPNDPKWTPDAKLRFERAVRRAHPRRKAQILFRVYRSPHSYQREQWVRGGWVDHGVLDQLEKTYNPHNMDMDGFISWREHRHSAADEYRESEGDEDDEDDDDDL